MIQLLPLVRPLFASSALTRAILLTLSPLHNASRLEWQDEDGDGDGKRQAVRRCSKAASKTPLSLLSFRLSVSRSIDSGNTGYEEKAYVHALSADRAGGLVRHGLFRLKGTIDGVPLVNLVRLGNVAGRCLITFACAAGTLGHLDAVPLYPLDRPILWPAG
jgi:hypothetical protein